MRRLCFTVLATVALTAFSFASSLDDYLKVRKSVGVKSVTSTDVLKALVGTKTLEINGIVKGAVSVGDGTCLLVALDNNDTLYVKAKEVPTWLDGNEIHVRMIIKAERESDMSDLTANLVAVISSVDIEGWEAKTGRSSGTKSSAAKSTSQDSGDSALYGSIGKKGSRLDRSNRTKNLNTSRSGVAPRARNKEGVWTVSREEAYPLYAQFAKKENRRLTDAQAWAIGKAVVDMSDDFGVDGRLVMAIILQESSFDPNSVSRTGARGLGQLMDGTAKELGVRNSHNINENIYGSVKLISQHLVKYRAKTSTEDEAIVLALAAYNAGPGAVSKFGGVPPYAETQDYVRKVMGYYKAIKSED